MNRENAERVVRTLLWYARPKIAEHLNSKIDLNSQRPFLHRLRDKLHEACELFQRGWDCEDQAELYLPLFDALFFVTAALARYPVDGGKLREAADVLECLHEQLEGVPA